MDNKILTLEDINKYTGKKNYFVRLTDMLVKYARKSENEISDYYEADINANINDWSVKIKYSVNITSYDTVITLWYIGDDNIIRGRIKIYLQIDSETKKYKYCFFKVYTYYTVNILDDNIVTPITSELVLAERSGNVTDTFDFESFDEYLSNNLYDYIEAMLF